MILQTVKKEIYNKYKSNIFSLVITVPAYFDNEQRLLVKKAADISKLNIDRLINEPTAAALCYGLNKGKNENILVFDLGGGTFDLSLLEIDDNVIETIFTIGDLNLGGTNINKLLYDYIIKNYKKINEDLLKREIENIKINCSDLFKKSKKRIYNTKIEGIHITLNYEMLNEICLPFKNKIELLLNKIPIELKKNIHKIIFDRWKFPIIFIKQLLKTHFINKNILIFDEINPDYSVSIGAVKQAQIIYNKKNDIKDDNLLIDITPFSIGVKGKNDEMIRLINKNSTIPIKITKTFTTTRENQKWSRYRNLSG